MDDYLHQAITKDMTAMNLSSSPAKAVSTPSKALPLAPPISLATLNQQQSQPSSPSRETLQQKPLPLMTQQQPLPSFTTPLSPDPRETPASTHNSLPAMQHQQHRPRRSLDLATDNRNMDPRRSSAVPSPRLPQPQPQPIETKKQAQKYPSFSTLLPSPFSPSTPPPSQQQSQETAVTALSSVVIPALEAALHRRAYNLNAAMQRPPTSTSFSNSPQPPLLSVPELQKLQQGHETVRRLVGKAIRVMTELDEADSRHAVGMGGGVESFLEGFLEEVLVRVEAEDVEAAEIG